MANDRRFFVGSYSPSNENGIHLLKIDTGTGMLTHLESTCGVENPSYLRVGNNKKNLYAVTELVDGGALNAFSIKDGRLFLINRHDTAGAAPCHVEVTSGGTMAFTANYLGGSISVFSLAQDGSIRERLFVKRHKGSSVNAERQEAAHVHFVRCYGERNEIYVSDLGLDRIFCYKFDETTGRLTEEKEKSIHIPAGCGPRHFVISPVNSGIMYVVCELTSQILTVDISGKPKIIQTLSTLPKGCRVSSTCAAIKMSEDGGIIFASNRGHDSVASFMAGDGGMLELADIAATGGKTPRDMAVLDNCIVCANQDSNNLTVLKYDNKTGKLHKTDSEIELQKPVCIVEY